jgi:hypothetical protein
MKSKVLSCLLGVALAAAAVWCFNQHNWSQILIAGLFSLSAVITFLTDAQSKILIGIRQFLIIIAFFFAALLFFKLVFARLFV